jgi:hypothetical protein
MLIVQMSRFKRFVARRTVVVFHVNAHVMFEIRFGEKRAAASFAVEISNVEMMEHVFVDSISVNCRVVTVLTFQQAVFVDSNVEF